MADANTLTFTDATFDTDVLKSDVPVLVDFWAEWCGPCRMMSPTVDAIAKDYLGRLKVGKLNVDDNGGTAMRYNVRGIPTLLLFKGGQIVAQKVGAVGRPDLQALIDAHVDAAGSVPAPAPTPVSASAPDRGAELGTANGRPTPEVKQYK
ncbi:MAG TPA: thioredoxin TrxA [Bryobacteraceae bacterium]|nr:thioredoxin TrxA [Bryobacteraceae bacterium]